MKKVLIIFLVLFILSCGRKSENGNSKVEPEVSVKVTEVKKGTIYQTISFVGDVHGQKEAKVYAKVPGKLIKKVKSEGDFVKENEIIALIDRDEPAMDFAEAEVRSPIDGIVTQYFVNLGESVFPAQLPVVMVANLEKVKIEVWAGETEINKISKGMQAMVKTDAYPDEIFWGTVSEIDASVNTTARKSKVQIEVPNQNFLLKQGMFTRVEIITKVHKDILVVPVSAVLLDPTNPEQKIVFVLEQNIAKKVNVITGIEDKEKIEIVSGLQDGQNVIIEGNYGLLDGSKVIVQN